MLFPALAALGGAFFFLVLRVQGADGSFPRPLEPEEEARLRDGAYQKKLAAVLLSVVQEEKSAPFP